MPQRVLTKTRNLFGWRKIKSKGKMTNRKSKLESEEGFALK